MDEKAINRLKIASRRIGIISEFLKGCDVGAENIPAVTTVLSHLDNAQQGIWSLLRIRDVEERDTDMEGGFLPTD